MPTGSMRAKKPSPPTPICHCTGPVGLPENVTELAVVLRAAVRLGRSRGREIRADIAGIEFDRVQTGVHVEPRRIDADAGRVRHWLSHKRRRHCPASKMLGGTRHERERMLIDVHHFGVAAVTAGQIVPRRVSVLPKPDFKRIEERAVGIVWIDRDALVVPVLRIIAAALPGCSP